MFQSKVKSVTTGYSVKTFLPQHGSMQLYEDSQVTTSLFKVQILCILQKQTKSLSSQVVTNLLA